MLLFYKTAGTDPLSHPENLLKTFCSELFNFLPESFERPIKHRPLRETQIFSLLILSFELTEEQKGARNESYFQLKQK